MAHQDTKTHLDNYRRDLLQHDRSDELGARRELPTRSAYDLKEAHDRLRSLPDDVLKQIPVLASRTQLEEGSTYFDLQHPERGAFKGMNNEEAEPDNCLIAKTDVDYELWNYLTGVTDTYRLGRFVNEQRPADKPLT
ncbi:MAG: hypothetical protein JWL77_3144 [Chthonomonadaceae bacterium]|nr:hypothetical protein [Chthonomonadaceae bacterium]